MTTSIHRTASLLALVALLLLPSWASAFQVTRGSAEVENRIIIAGVDGASLTYASGLRLELEPGTRLRQHKDADLWMDSTGKTATEVFTLVEGRLQLFRPLIDGQRPKAALVRTSRKLMAVTKNGEMTVAAEPERGLVANYRGTALLSLGGSWSRLDDGRFATVTRALPTITFQELPAAPSLEISQRLWMSLQDKAKVGGFRWTRASDNAHYRVSVSEVGSAQPTEVRDTTSLELAGGEIALGPGEYEARVQTVNAYGLMGPYSAPQAFRVVGVQTNRGARVDKAGTVHLGMNQRAEFLYVDGLLMAYGSSSRWAPATTSVPLHDQQPTSIHFRLPNSSEIVSARLEPRGVVADVFVGSKMARWPGDTVDIVVQLRDESGSVNAETVDATVEVTLGIEPLNLQFTRQGATLRASIPPQPGPGPWVVRATVLDQHGVELGRDFLEIAERVADGPNAKRPNAGNQRTAKGSEDKTGVVVARVP